MPTPVSVNIANPDPNVAPTTFQQAINIIRTLLSGSIDGNFNAYVTGSGTPATDDQDKIWGKTDSAGRPVGLFKYYSGAWRRFYNTPLGTISWTNRNPSVDFETTGLGKVGGEYDGWALCDGRNGTPNMTDRFHVSAHMDESGGHDMYDGGWRTVQGGVSSFTGGEGSITLDADTTYRPARAAIEVSNWQADANTPEPAGGLYGHGTLVTLLAADAGNTTPDPIPTVPPFFAFGAIQFIGYE